MTEARQISIRPGTKADIEEAAHITTLARASNPFDWACYPACYSETGESSSPQQQQALLDLVHSRMKGIREPRYQRSEKKFFVAVLEEPQFEGNEDLMKNRSAQSSSIVGHVQWEVLPHGTSESEWQTMHAEHHNLPPVDEFLVDINPVSKAVVGVDVPHIRLTDVYVHPSYQRQGIASRLAVLAVKDADALNLPMYLEATPDGGKVYPRLGFEIKSELSYDLSPHGVQTKPYVNYIMWRKAPSIS